MNKQVQLQSNITIKIRHNKAIFNLGKNIFSYEDLVESIQSRLPDVRTNIVHFQQNQVSLKNFTNFIKQRISKGDKSIKLELRQVEITQNKQNCKTKRFPLDADQFDNKTKKQAERQQSLKLKEQKQQGPIRKTKQSFVKPQNIKIKVLIENDSSRIKKQTGVQYTWSCSLVNESEIQIPQKVYIVDSTSHKQIQLKGLGINEARQVCFGPYLEKQAGRHTHLYQIIYKKNEQNHHPICSKFGFVCDAEKKVEVKQFKNSLYQRVNELRNFTECQKSVQYIVQRLKEIRIGEETIIHYQDEVLIDIIESLGKE